MKNALQKILAFVVICVYVLCTIGGTGYLFYYHQPLFAVSTLALAVLAFPSLKKAWNVLNS